MPPNKPKLRGFHNNHSFSLTSLQIGWGSVDLAGLLNRPLILGLLGTCVPWRWQGARGQKESCRASAAPEVGHSHFCPHPIGRSLSRGQVHRQRAGKIHPASRGTPCKATEGRCACGAGWTTGSSKASYHSLCRKRGAGADNPRVSAPEGCSGSVSLHSPHSCLNPKEEESQGRAFWQREYV